MIVTALIATAALLPTPAVPGSPVHVTGWYQMGPASIYGANNMHEAPGPGITFALPAGSYVRSYFGGTCRVDGGPLSRSTPLTSVICRGNG